ncbi:hypothetical protein E3U25_01010 (plasmid) [Paracoccus versutus]|nr:hypothetical protein E3U25_01010 [Paracoccus versutus]
MFVVDLRYTAPIERVDAAVPEHIQFVKANFAAGVFIASGRKDTGDGGLIIAVAENRAQLEAILLEDPFKKLELAEFHISGFEPAMMADQLGE